MSNGNTPNLNESNAPKPFNFDDDPKKKSIYDRLSRLVGPGAAAFYKDACRHMASMPPFDATTHIVGHLLREIESSLRDVLESIADPIKTQKGVGDEEKHKQEILVILKAVGVSDSDPISQAWLSLPGDNGLQSRAHRRNLESVRPLDRDFLEFWSQMETILDVILDKFESQYIKIFALLDTLAQKSDPVANDAKTIHLHVPNNLVAHQKFFNQLDNPKWLPLLRAEGLFSDPPQPEHDYEAGTIRHLPWPESSYLEKMASIDPDTVTEILQEVKDSDNSNVKSSLLRIAALLPKGKRLLLIGKAKGWLKTDYQFFQGSLVGPGAVLMNKFVEDPAEDSAFEIAKVFLEILPDSKPILIGQEYVPLRHPKSRLEHWDYNEFLKRDFQKLIELNPRRSFDFVCDLLSDYLKFQFEGRKENENDFEDTSCLSRPAIEDHEQNRGDDDIENTLITAIRDIGLKIITNNSSELETIIAELENRKWSVFRRIGLYLLSESLESAKKLVARYLTDETLFDNYNFKHEQARLMNKGFKLLTTEQQDVILGWIGRAEKITERVEKRKQETSVSDNEEQRFKEVWQRDQLSYMKDDLPDGWKKRYSGFVKKYGEPEHPDFPTYMTSWSGPTSDVRAQELADMDLDNLINLLRTWQPKNEPHGFGSTKEGLGRELGAAIKLGPDKFRDIPDKFEGLDPTYIRAYIQAFYELAQNGFELNWPKILKLCLWVIKQPREIPDRQGEIMDQDPDWGWTRKAIASLISRGANSNVIPCELRKNIWEILEALTRDPDPTPEDESKHDEHYDDAYLAAINCARGQAMNATAEYSLWVYRCIEKQLDVKEKIKAGFDLMPEARSVFEWHLDPINDPSIAVHSIYGRFFPWLLLMDRKWTMDHLDMIFPPGQFGDRLYNAAWNTLMLHVPVYNDPFDVLKSRYHEAIMNLGKVDTSKGRYINRDKSLAEQLMLQYGRSRIELSDELLKCFWAIASDELCGHALDFVGRSLKNEGRDFDQDVLDRMRVLWESRIAEAKYATDKSKYLEEMSAFGWWFASGRFEDKWSCDQYLEALEIGRKTRSDYHVFRRLVESVKTLPSETVQILKKLVLAEQSGWIVLGNKEEVNTILSVALAAPEGTARKEATDLINRLMARGHTEFGNLLAMDLNAHEK